MTVKKTERYPQCSVCESCAVEHVMSQLTVKVFFFVFELYCQGNSLEIDPGEGRRLVSMEWDCRSWAKDRICHKDLEDKGTSKASKL